MWVVQSWSRGGVARWLKPRCYPLELQITGNLRREVSFQGEGGHPIGTHRTGAGVECSQVGASQTK
ncbi:MAG: hypothetical protein ACK55I_21365, partial [bacterium]